MHVILLLFSFYFFLDFGISLATLDRSSDLSMHSSVASVLRVTAGSATWIPTLTASRTETSIALTLTAAGTTASRCQIPAKRIPTATQ